jgi:hypothetical protein
MAERDCANYRLQSMQKTKAAGRLLVCATTLWVTTGNNCQTTTLLQGASYQPTSIAVASSHVYFTNVAVGAAAVDDYPLDGAPLFQLAAEGAGGEPGSIAVNSTNVYWVDRGQVMMVPRIGGSPSVISGDFHGDLQVPLGVPYLAANESGVYWANTGDERLLFIPSAGNGPVSLLPSTNPDTHLNYYPVSVALDAVNAYFTTDDGSVYSVPQSGEVPRTPTLLASGPFSRTSAIATDGSYVYWAAYAAGSIQRVPVDGTAPPTTLVTGQTNLMGLAVDADNVYWAIHSASGIIWKAPVGGGSTPTAFAIQQAYPVAVALDATNVYWADDDAQRPAVSGVLTSSK